MVNEQAVIQFLKKYGNLENNLSPLFKAKNIPKYVHPIAMRDSFRRNDPLFYREAIDGKIIYKNDFNKMNLKSQSLKKFETSIIIFREGLSPMILLKS